MKFMIGYQASPALVEAVLRHRDRIAEIYFPWPGFTSGRGVPDTASARQLDIDLDTFAAAGLGFNLLLNGNCYGRRSQSRKFFQEIGDTVQLLRERLKLGSVTTTSLLIGKFLHANFPGLEVRASVNMEIGDLPGFEYVADCFDGFYLKREYNYCRPRIVAASNWCRTHGKKIYLLANSGCLNFCSAHNFHDNLVAHQHEIAEMDNAYDFSGVCHEFYAVPEHRAEVLRRGNFIRPEDLALYENWFDGVKLATRTCRNPAAVVDAYADGRFSGNLLELTEPCHAAAFYPEIVANDRIPGDYAEFRLDCGGNCASCRRCEDIFHKSIVNLATIGETARC